MAAIRTYRDCHNVWYSYGRNYHEKWSNGWPVEKFTRDTDIIRDSTTGGTDDPSIGFAMRYKGEPLVRFDGDRMTIKVTLAPVHLTRMQALLDRLNAVGSVHKLKFTAEARVVTMTHTGTGHSWTFRRDIQFQSWPFSFEGQRPSADDGEPPSRIPARFFGDVVTVDADGAEPLVVPKLSRFSWKTLGRQFVAAALPLEWDWAAVDVRFYKPGQAGTTARRELFMQYRDCLVGNPPTVIEGDKIEKLNSAHMSLMAHLLDRTGLQLNLMAWQDGSPLAFTPAETAYFTRRSSTLLREYCVE